MNAVKSGKILKKLLAKCWTVPLNVFIVPLKLVALNIHEMDSHLDLSPWISDSSWN